MLRDYVPSGGDPEIAAGFAALLVDSFNSQERMPVSQLFNEWWRFCPADVAEKYRQAMLRTPGFAESFAERYFGPPIDLDALLAMPPGSLGRVYGEFIRDNNLAPQIAMDYRARHERLEAAGLLDNMPEELRYGVLRGFQMHDYMHVLTGYRAMKTGEQAVLAFCLAQMNFPYFGIWMSVTTTRMTFVDPDMIDPLMTAISDGWQAGKRAENVQFARFEDMLHEPLMALRRRYRIATAETERSLAA